MSLECGVVKAPCRVGCLAAEVKVVVCKIRQEMRGMKTLQNIGPSLTPYAFHLAVVRFSVYRLRINITESKCERIL